MSDITPKLSHIILYVDKTIPEDDILAFCTNIRSEEPKMGFTYLCYDNLFQQTETDTLVNLTNSLQKPYNSLFIITDSQNAIKFASEKGIACAGLTSQNSGNNSLSGVLYCIEDIEFIDLPRINRMWQRFHGIPWLIMVTKRLMIREQTIDDLDSLYEIYADRDVSEFVEPLYADREKEKRYLLDYIENQYRFYEYGMWALCLADTGRLIGRAGIGIREGYDIPEIGYVIAADFRRKGYAREALEGIIKYGCDEFGFDKYMAFTSSRNIPSVRLLESLGFCRSGHDEIMGRMHDMYILTKQ